MPMQEAPRQKPAPAGRMGKTHGETVRDPVSDEAACPRHETEYSGPGFQDSGLSCTLS